jgi:hypothetical protein
MNPLNYFLIGLIVYSGLLVGAVLSFMAKEELKSGRKYFILVHNIIVAFILYFFLEFLNINVYLILLLPLVLVVFLFRYSEIYSKSWVIYIILGLIFYLSSKDDSSLLIISSLIFFYGFLVSALHINTKNKNYYLTLGNSKRISGVFKNNIFDILLKNLGFFVGLVILFFISTI